MPPSPPGPRGMTKLGTVRRFRKDALAYFLWLRRQYGDFVLNRLGPLVLVNINDPAAIRHVLVEHPERYTKGDLLHDLAPLLGHGLLRSEGDLWRQRRKTVTPFLARPALARYLPSIQEETRSLIARWRKAPQPVDVAREAMTFTLRVVTRAVLGFDLGSRVDVVHEAVETVSAVSSQRTFALLRWPLFVPTPSHRRYQRAIATLHRVVEAVATREHQGEGPGIVAPLREAGLDSAALREEIMTLLLAGHETTASSLAWALDYLAFHPEVAERCREELAAAGADPLEVDFPNQPSLEYLDAVVSETLRLRPPGWILGRRAREAGEICGYEVPKGAIVSLVAYATHRHPDHFPDPEQFRPDRFLPPSPPPPAVAYYPFGAGPRRCPGEPFARLELKVTLGAIVSRFDLQPTGDPAIPAPLMTLRPKGSVRLRMSPIRGPSASD